MFKGGKAEKGSSKLYDSHITATIPYYQAFNLEIINLVRAAVREPLMWLDTGCGTGNLASQAAGVFPRTKFTLADPSSEMLREAERKIGDTAPGRYRIMGPCATQEISLPDGESPDVISAVLCHHYLDVPGRKNATGRCFQLLREGGLYITFENTRPMTAAGTETGLANWQRFQVEMGKPATEAQDHVKRFNVEYFPITIEEHIALLRESGFRIVELLWFSYLQAGFYAVK